MIKQERMAMNDELKKKNGKSWWNNEEGQWMMKQIGNESGIIYMIRSGPWFNFGSGSKSGIILFYFFIINYLICWSGWTLLGSEIVGSGKNSFRILITVNRIAALKIIIIIQRVHWSGLSTTVQWSYYWWKLKLYLMSLVWARRAYQRVRCWARVHQWLKGANHEPTVRLQFSTPIHSR
jgi:hypothetical protein